MTITTTEELEKEIGTNNFRFKVLNKLPHDTEEGKFVIELQILGALARTVYINEPANKKWRAIAPTAGYIYSGKLAYYRDMESWYLMALKRHDLDLNPCSEVALPTSEEKKPIDSYLTRYIDLPVKEKFTASCYVLDTTKTHPSMLLRVGKEVHQIAVSSTLNAAALHCKEVTFKLTRSKKRARLKLVSIDGVITQEHKALFEKKIQVNVAEDGFVPCVLPAPTFTVQAGKLYKNIRYNTVTVVKVEPLEEDFLVWFHRTRSDTPLYLTLADFKDQYTELEMWYDNIPETGIICKHIKSKEIKVAYPWTFDKANYTPLSKTETLALVLDLAEKSEDNLPF